MGGVTVGGGFRVINSKTRYCIQSIEGVFCKHKVVGHWDDTDKIDEATQWTRKTPAMAFLRKLKRGKKKWKYKKAVVVRIYDTGETIELDFETLNEKINRFSEDPFYDR